MTPPTPTLLVDLDGTLTDPADGILGGFEFALRKLGAPVPSRDSLGWVIGPPLRKAFPKLLPDPSTARVEAAVQAYREYYGSHGIFEARVYEGIPEMLAGWRESGHRLMLCTAKPAAFATKVVEHFDLARHFDRLYGPDLEGRLDDKGDLIAHMIDVEQLDHREMLMIGDRGSDATAALRNGLPCIGVTWGYGSPDELTAAGAAPLCTTPGHLRDAVRAWTPGTTK